jgi:hypothetical protein
MSDHTFHTTDLGEQLIDYSISNTRPAVRRTSLFRDSVQFIEDDNVKLAVITLLLVL